MPMPIARRSRKSDALHATLALILVLTHDAAASRPVVRASGRASRAAAAVATGTSSTATAGVAPGHATGCKTDDDVDRTAAMHDSNRDVQPRITVPHLTGIFVSLDSVTAARSLAGWISDLAGPSQPRTLSRPALCGPHS